MKKLLCYLVHCVSLLSISNFVIAQKSPVINHIAFSVTDLKRSVSFYSNIIGLDTIPEPFKDGRHAWFSIGENISLHLIQDATATKTYYKNSHLCLSTPSLVPFIEKLKRENIEYENVQGKRGEMTTRIDGVHQIYLRDPDGYWLEINDARK